MDWERSGLVILFLGKDHLIVNILRLTVQKTDESEHGSKSHDSFSEVYFL